MSSTGTIDTVPPRLVLHARPAQPVLPGRRPAVTHRLVDLVANVAVLAALWFAYAAVRGVTADDMASALGNARHVLDVERSLHLPEEAWLQEQALRWTWLVRAANGFYLYVHFPLTAVFLAWTWLRHRDLYSRVRDTLVLVTGAALVLHVAMPLAPPRMMPGFVDTGAVHGPSPYDLAAASAANQIAAMPSLHVGWSLLLGVAAVTGSVGRRRWLALAHPVLTTAVVVVTANHYWADGIVAAVLVAAAWWATGRFQRRRAKTPTAAAAPVIDLRPVGGLAPTAAGGRRATPAGRTMCGRQPAPCRAHRACTRRGPLPERPSSTPSRPRGRTSQGAGRAAPGRPPQEERRHDRPDTGDGFDR